MSANVIIKGNCRRHKKPACLHLFGVNEVWNDIPARDQEDKILRPQTLFDSNLHHDSVEISFCAISHLLLSTLVPCQWVSVS